MPKRSSKRKSGEYDPQKLARKVLDTVAPDAESEPKPAKNPAAVMLGRLGGLKGGRARAESLSKKRRSDIAAKAARSRWNKAKGG